jgi:hypothetical protein
MFHPDGRQAGMEHTMAADGLTTIPSSYGPKDTMNRLEAAVKAKGMTGYLPASIMRPGRARLDYRCGRPRS